jgi:hypothetical protein
MANETLWHVESRGGANAEILGIGPDPFRHDGSSVIVVKDSERLWGTRAVDGSTLWTARIPQVRRGRGFVTEESKAMPLISGMRGRPHDRSLPIWPRNELAAVTAPPLIAFSFGDTTVVRPASSANGDLSSFFVGLNAKTSPAPDPRLQRPLPWMADVDFPARAPFMEWAGWFAWMALLSLTLVFMPGVYLGRLLRYRRWSLRALLLAPLLVSGALVVLGLPAPGPGSMSWGQKWFAAATAVPFWFIVTCLVSWTSRRNWYRLVSWLALTIVTAAGFGALLITIDLSKQQELTSYSWDGWYWLWLGCVYWCGWLLLPAAMFGPKQTKKAIERLRAP